MTDRIDENPPMSIPEQAAEWLLRWHCGDLSIAERFEYLQWLKTSPVHIAETLRMCRLYSWLENTKLKLFITNEDSFSNIVELPPREREVVLQQIARYQALENLAIGKKAFFDGDATTAHRRLSQANEFFKSRKLSLICRLLRAAPWLLSRAYDLRDRFILKRSTKY